MNRLDDANDDCFMQCSYSYTMNFGCTVDRMGEGDDAGNKGGVKVDMLADKKRKKRKGD